MRFLKKLLVCVYVYLGVFAAAELILTSLTGNEASTLITCVFGVAGVESMIGAVIKGLESKKQNDSKNSGTQTAQVRDIW